MLPRQLLAISLFLIVGASAVDLDSVDVQQRNLQTSQEQQQMLADAENKDNKNKDANEGAVVTKDPQPFEQNVVMESIGGVLMFLLIALSNAGGLSGAGSNIPIILIFYKMHMDRAVPLSACVAVIATSFRYVYNFRQKHPRDPNRNLINYEMVSVSMPLVFLGSFVGVILGKLMGNVAQICVFEITVAWSIYTTADKAIQMYKKENVTSVESDNQSPLIEEEKREEIDITDPKIDEELRAIYYSEKYHITKERSIFILVNLGILIVVQTIYKNKSFEQWIRYGTAIVFVLLMIVMTFFSVKDVNRIHKVKNEKGYKFDSQDYKFNSVKDIAMLSFFCMIAAILCGATGIAGGMVLGPLFLTYDMQPQVMAATNQFITLIASIAVASQFAYLGVIYWGYAILYMFLSILAVWLGISMVNIYVKKTGKQSIILIILVICLSLAFVSIPLKAFLK